MHPWEWLGRVPPWMRIPSLPGTHFKIGSSRLNFGERVTPTLYIRAGIALDALSMVVQKALPSTNRLPKIPSPDCVFLLSVMYIFRRCKIKN